MNKWIAEFDLEDGDTMPEHMDLEYKGARIDFHCRPLEQEPTTKNNLGVDCIARQDVERYIEGFINEYTPKEELEFINLELDGLKHLPPVTPQAKTGHWKEEFNDIEGEVRFVCSSCGKFQLFGTDFCYNCGARMFESQESEDKTDD